jgi:4-amino-4-deoxy-L-arabinose transferase-like glycosyltransferase
VLDAPEVSRVAADALAWPTPNRDVRLAARLRIQPLRVAEAGVFLTILGLSFALELVGLQSEAFGNTYYAAAVESMLANWHNFFFVSSDLAGFVSVDKPPLGLWIQVLSARLLGFNGVALLLPQALAGVASVSLLYVLVRRVYGGAAGLIAAAVLAVMPISVVTARNNTMDTTLVLTLLVAVWLVSLAAESGRLRLLLLSAAVVGLAFNIKMLQAYLVVPGMAFAYFVFAPLSWRRKFLHLSAALAVLLVVSLSWSVAVDLTPPDLRPYMGSSGSNSAIALALTYNGLGRVTQAIAPWLAMLHISVPLDLDNMPGMAPGIGSPGWWRLFNPLLAGQASWLLAPAIAGGIFATASIWLAKRWQIGPLRRESVALMVWGGWLVTCGAYFSFARFYHTYYLTMLGPAVAALVGIGVAALWRSYTRGEWSGWVLPLLLAGAAVLEVYFASESQLWQSRLEPWVLGITFGGSLALVGARLARTSALWQKSALSLALAGLLIAPTAWSVTSIQAGAGGAWLPAAGPSGAGFGPGGFRGGAPGGNLSGGGRGFAPGPGGPAGGPRGFGPSGATAGGPSMAMTFAGQNWDSLDPAVVNYLLANQGAATYVAATTTSSYGSVLTLLADRPVMALGGYQGWDRILDPAQLASLVQQDAVRFFLLSSSLGNRGFGGSQDATADLSAWVQSNCSVVSSATWQGRSSNGLQLYDCAAAVA